MQTQSSLGGNGNGNGHAPPPPPFDGDVEQLYLEHHKLKNRVDTAELESGAILPFLSRIEAQGKQTALEVSAMHTRLFRLDNEKEIRVEDVREIRRKMRTFETEMNRKQVQLDAALERGRQDSQHDLEDTQRRAVMTSAEAAEKIAEKAGAKRERLDPELVRGAARRRR